MSRSLITRIQNLESARGDDNDLKWFSWPDEAHASERAAMAEEIRACKTRLLIFMSYDNEDSLPDDLKEYEEI